MNYYFAMLEIQNIGHTDKQYQRLVDTMNELKAAAAPIGKCTYYQVALEAQYRKAEKEIKAQVKNDK